MLDTVLPNHNIRRRSNELLLRAALAFKIKGRCTGWFSYGCVFLFLALIFSGCMMGPDYERPQVEVPQTWRFEASEAADLVNTVWWQQFTDPVLDELITIALQENTDVRIATARIEEYLGRYRVSRADLFPQVGGEADAGRERASEADLPRGVSGAFENPDDFLQAFFSASWELDLWGRLRRSTEAARAEVLSTAEARRAVILSLVQAVATAYVNLRDLDKELEIAERTTATRKESLDIFQLRFDAGVISELELRQVESEYQASLATIPQIEKAIVFQEDALSILLGRNPQAIVRGKTLDELVLPQVPAGLPSEVLEQRPDIRGAEQDLIAANARIGVARAAYFPSLILTGAYGSASSDLGDLFSGSAKIWSYAASLTQPIFTGGRIRGNVQVAEAIQQQLLVRYQQVIQNAFREVDDSLIDQAKTREQLAAEAGQVEALRSYARLARLRYDEGYTSFIEVLDAERSLFNAELSYTQTQATLFQSLINLYAAMGGGWVLEAEDIAVQPLTADSSPQPDTMPTGVQ
ncbi:MAG TPA: efflux transporter outer membrane subunit [Thermodesulfobacteriota bacterium]|nr:efflux transporter outer membrane subunit [Thermodesulfobacteriota bacterium]